MSKTETECRLRDDKGRLVTIAPRELALRYLKHELPDGDYSIEGPGIDMVFYRHEGVVYPSGGTIDGKRMPPRSREGCVDTFGK